jgi:hypothetical protein
VGSCVNGISDGLHWILQLGRWSTGEAFGDLFGMVMSKDVS